MKISYSWLKQYVDHPLSPEALASTLTMGGLEVEEIEHIGSALEGVVVGHVLDVKQHPNADRLTVCQVDIGQAEPVQIVCGAPNVAAGQKAPVATLGTTLYLPGRDDSSEKVAMKIKKAKLRGERSEGMICAEDELGLSEDHSGIMVLSEDAAVGEPFAVYLEARGVNVQDAVLDIAITPNRPDAVSHIGVGRDVAALTENALVKPEVTLPAAGGEAATHIEVEIEAPVACPRYVALLVRNVQIKPSPPWLQQRLQAIGLRPRNNVVDVTNYVMYECGQPLHAFDYDQIAGRKIVVRLTAGEEPFTTLDGKERTLPAGTILICDADRAVAIGGIMGGENSEVTEGTTNVLIESAYFDPSTIRRAAKALGLSTDASYRFERGVDSEGQVWAAARAAELITALAGGERVSGMVDAHPAPAPRRVVSLRLARIGRILGVEVAREDAIRYLRALGFGVDAAAAAVVHCTIPPYRPDVEREIDLIEEVARIYGFDRIPEPSHSVLPNVTPRLAPEEVVRHQAYTLLVGLGYREIYTNSMLRAEQAEAYNVPMVAAAERAGPIVETLNPISQEMTALRPSLLPGLLQVMQFNSNHGQEVLRFFEFGHVFHRTEREEVPVPGYGEHESFIIGLSGPAVSVGWDTPSRLADLYDAKGVVAALLEALRLPEVELVPVYEETPLTEVHLEIRSAGLHLGVVGTLAASLVEGWNLKGPAYFAELDWTTLVALALPHRARRYMAVNRYPVVERDLAVMVEQAEAVGPMLDTIRTAGQPLLRQARVFDLYEGERIEAGKKSVAFGLQFGADRTLTDAEVDAQLKGILHQLTKNHRADLRQ